MKLQNSDYFDSEDSYWEEVAKIRKKYSLEPNECGEFVEYVQSTIPYHNPNIPIQEVEEDDCESQVWSVKDGPVLDQDSQDALNEAFNTFVNENGLTMKEVIDNKNE